MKVAIYARISTADKDQDPETQLMAIRDYCEMKGWNIVEEFVDEVPARDLRRRISWRKLLDASARRQFHGVVVFKLDRAFRSVKDMLDTLAMWDSVGVTFVSTREQFDTTTPIGRLLLNIMASLAEFELETIRERVIAGMDRARRQGKEIGRPKSTITEHPAYTDVMTRLAAGDLTVRGAAAELEVSTGTVMRYKARTGVQKGGFDS